MLREYVASETGRDETVCYYGNELGTQDIG